MASWGVTAWDWVKRQPPEAKVITVVYEYTYQDHEYITRTMNTKHNDAVWLSCSKLHSVVLRHRP